MPVNVQFLQQLQPEWSRFVMVVKQSKEIGTILYHTLFDILKQYQNEVNDIRAERIVKSANPLALLAAAQPYSDNYYQAPKSQRKKYNIIFRKTKCIYQTQRQIDRQTSYTSICVGNTKSVGHFQVVTVFIVNYTLSNQQFTTNQSTPLINYYPSNDNQSTIHHNVYSPQPSNPQLEYAPTAYQQQQPKFSQPDSNLVVPVFQKGDDLIDAINHMMSFLTAVVTSRYPTTNNQLRTSSNPRQQATIYDGKVTVQPVQGRQTTYAAGTTRKYTPGASGSNTGKQQTVICYNCKGEGHIAKQCTKPKRKRDETWFNDKVLLVQAQASGQALTEEEIPLMANLSRNGSDALTEVLNPDNLTHDLINQSEQIMTSSEQSNDVSQTETEITSDSNIISYSQYLSETQQETVQNSNSSAQQDVLILSIFSGSNEQYAEIVRLKQNLFEQMQEKDSLMKTVSDLKNDLKMEENRNIDREIALEKKIKQLDNIIFKRGQSAQTVHMMTKSKICYDHSTKQAIGFEKPFYLKKARESKPKLYDGNTILKMDTIVIPDSDETLMLCEESRSKLLLKEQDPMVVPALDPSHSSTTIIVEVPKELPKVSMVNTSLKELKRYLTGFDQAVEQHRLESRTFEVKMNQVLSENERLLAQAIDNDIVKIDVNLSVNDGCETMNEYQRCLELKTELLNKKDFVDKETYDKLFKSFTTLEKHCITLEADSQ
ncbi:retrovirus-related pol polyprotein from transposon TNT 1-94 [Tanacetum coccineum]